MNSDNSAWVSPCYILWKDAFGLINKPKTVRSASGVSNGFALLHHGAC